MLKITTLSFIKEAEIQLTLDESVQSVEYVVAINKKGKKYQTKFKFDGDDTIVLYLDNLPDFGSYLFWVNGSNELSTSSDTIITENGNHEWKYLDNERYFIQSKRLPLSDNTRDIVVLDYKVVSNNSIEIIISKKVKFKKPKIVCRDQKKGSIEFNLPSVIRENKIKIDLSTIDENVIGKYFIFLKDKKTNYRFYFPKVKVTPIENRFHFIRGTEVKSLFTYISINGRLACQVVSENKRKEIEKNKKIIISDLVFNPGYSFSFYLEFEIPKGASFVIQRHHTTISLDVLSIEDSKVTLKLNKEQQFTLVMGLSYQVFITYEGGSIVRPLILNNINGEKNKNLLITKLLTEQFIVYKEKKIYPNWVERTKNNKLTLKFQDVFLAQSVYFEYKERPVVKEISFEQRDSCTIDADIDNNNSWNKYKRVLVVGTDQEGSTITAEITPKEIVRLAVIVPCYNVELFLKEALDSLLIQGVPASDMQIILIDDGSKDSTLEIANSYARKYPDLIEVHSFENAGLGAARNRGTRLANAEYITFVDSDDIVVENSYRKALDILEETRSEILVGGTKRFNSKKIWSSTIHSKAISRDLRKVTLNENPELIWDSTSWNKIYNLDFIRKNNLYFPEGMLYEDLPTVTPALQMSKSIDVMSDTMYLWRVRDTGAPSITQISNNDISPILDRFKANSSVMNSLIHLNASKNILDAQASKFLNFDTMMIIRKDKYELFSIEQKMELFHALKKYLSIFNYEQIQLSRFENLVYFEQVLNIETQEEFDKITLNFLRNETNYSGEWNDNKYLLKSDLSDFTRIATAEDFCIETKLEEVAFSDSDLTLKGYVFAKYSDMSNPGMIKNAHINLLNNENEIVAENVGEITFFENKGITAKFGYNSNHFVKDVADFNYDFSGYEIKISLKSLTLQLELIKVQLNFTVDGQELTTLISKPVTGEKVRPKTKVSECLQAAYDIKYDTNDWTFNFIPTLDIPILKVSEGIFKVSNAFENVFLQQGKTKLPLIKLGDDLQIPKEISERLSSYGKEGRGDWYLMTEKDDEQKNIYFSQDVVSLPHPTFYKTLLAENGMAKLSITWYYPKIKSANVEESNLILEFELSGWECEAVDVSVIADPQLPEIVWGTHKISENIYRLKLPLTLDGFGEKEWLNFHVDMKFSDGYETKQVLKWDDNILDLEGKQISANNISWEFRRVVRNNGGFAIKRTADRVYREEVGAFERFIETEYMAWVKEPLLEDHIMMSSFWGRNNQFNDNPEALYRYVSKHFPDMTTIIMMKDAICSYPEYPNAKVVSYGTKEYWYYLARAKYFVNNVNFTEPERVKRKNQVEVQTMHGTPLKTLGFDVLDDWKDASYLETLRKNKNWDYLITPSDWVSEYAQKAFQVSPQIIKSGYPRNDKLFSNKDLQEIASLKVKLGLPVNKKIIAYAPTWRKKAETSISEYLDIQSFYDAIPDDTFVVLKNHHFEPWTGLSSKFNDKFAYADEEASIEEIYIVSDALITDYSSVMFDYILLKKPMIFYAFDYETYIESRGINFDFRNEAPGPLIENQSDLHQWISCFEDISSKFTKNISDFEQKFVQYDIGNACEQVISQIMGDIR